MAATSIAAGIGGSAGGAGGSLLGVLGALVGWALYAWIAYVVGTRVLRGAETEADWGQVARTLGFANVPRFLLLLAVIPGLAGLVALVVLGWVLLATIVALRSALDMSTGRAIATAIVSWLAEALLIGLLFRSFV